MTPFRSAGCIACAALASWAVLLGGCAGKSVEDPKGPGPKLKVTSSAFREGEPIPREYTGEGADRSPLLSWEAPPGKTRSLAVLVEDPDAPTGTFAHWVLFNLPTGTREMPENAGAGKLPEGAVQATNDFGKAGYNGPKPPSGKAHHYYFKVFALDTRLDLDTRARRADVDGAMRGHLPADGALMGTYQHASDNK